MIPGRGYPLATDHERIGFRVQGLTQPPVAVLEKIPRPTTSRRSNEHTKRIHA